MKEEHLGNICDFTYGESLREDRRQSGRVPVYGSNGIVGWHNQAITKGPTIIIGRKGSIGEVNFSAVPCWPIDTTYYVDLPKKECDLRWLYHALVALDLTRLNKAAAVPGLNREDAYQKRVIFPPLPEQKRIAAILEKADRLRCTRRYARQLSDNFLQSVFIKMFGDPVRNPQGWDVELLEDICRQKDGVKAGPFGSSLKKEFYSKSGVRIYGQEQVIAGDFAVGDYYISLDMFEDFSAYEVQPGDLLISLVGTFGKVVVVPKGIERGIINPRLLKISPLHTQVDSVFLAHFIQHPIVQVALGRMSHGGTMGILNAGLLKQVRVIVPPLPLQQKFAAIVRRFERLRAQQREAEREAEHLFQTLLHRAFNDSV
jgi:type I restriction enzyme S subunit